MLRRGDHASPFVIAAALVGEAESGRQWGNFPLPPVPPRLAPRIPSHLRCSVVVTLGESVTWRRCSPRNRGGDRVGTQQGGQPLCKRNMPPVTRNPPAAHSLLHFASIAHSSRDDKEVTPCHPGLTAPTTAPTGGEHDPDPAADTARRDDRAYHLARVCARFPRTISTQGAHRLARLLRVSTDQSP